MPQSERYSIHRKDDRRWVVIDRARTEREVGQATDELGAQRIASLLTEIRSPNPPRWLSAK